MITIYYITNHPRKTTAWRTWRSAISIILWRPHTLWNARLMSPNIPRKRFKYFLQSCQLWAITRSLDPMHLSDTLNPRKSHYITQLAMSDINNMDEIAEALNRSVIGNFCAFLSLTKLVAENVLPISRKSNENHLNQIDILARMRAFLILYQVKKSNAADDVGTEGMEVGEVKEEEELLDPAGTPDYTGVNAGSRPETPPTPNPPTDPINIPTAADPPIAPMPTDDNAEALTDSGARSRSESVRSLPKDKGNRAPLSEEAKAARRKAEKARKKLRRAEELEAKRCLAETSRPQGSLEGDPNQSPKCTDEPRVRKPKLLRNPKKVKGKKYPKQIGAKITKNPKPKLRHPDEVFPHVKNPKIELTVTKEGAGASARSSLTMLLMLVPSDFTVGEIRVIDDGVVMEFEDETSLGVVRNAVEADGWVTQQSAIWNRYFFSIPDDLTPHPLDVIVRGLLNRNGRGVRGPEGIPDGSIRVVTTTEFVAADGSQRTRAYVDVSPEGEEYLRVNDNLLRTLNAGIRLKPATHRRPNSGGS